MARKRFLLGYPPRKDKDTSLGDALHWEWIVWCAINSASSANIMIVSRDSDFGVEHRGKFFLNDWLQREFKDRVSRQREIRFTRNLTDALSVLNEQVTEEDKAEEKRIIAKRKETRPTPLAELRRILEEQGPENFLDIYESMPRNDREE